jgi:hypothetical protein
MSVAAGNRRYPREEVEITPAGFVEEVLTMPLDDKQGFPIEREEGRVYVSLPESEHLGPRGTVIAARLVFAGRERRGRCAKRGRHRGESTSGESGDGHG